MTCQFIGLASTCFITLNSNLETDTADFYGKSLAFSGPRYKHGKVKTGESLRTPPASHSYVMKQPLVPDATA